MKALNEYRIIGEARGFVIERQCAGRRFWMPWKTFTRWMPLGRLHWIGAIGQTVWHEPKFYPTLEEARTVVERLVEPPSPRIEFYSTIREKARAAARREEACVEESTIHSPLPIPHPASL